MNVLQDDLLGEVMDCLDLNSLGALATANKRTVKSLYRPRCRSCGSGYVNRLGPRRKLRYLRLKRNDYRCPMCVRRFLQSLQLRLAELRELGPG